MLKQSAAKRCNERERERTRLNCQAGGARDAQLGWLITIIIRSALFQEFFLRVRLTRLIHQAEEEGIRKNVRNLCSDRDNVLQNFNANCLIH